MPAWERNPRRGRAVHDTAAPMPWCIALHISFPIRQNLDSGVQEFWQQNGAQGPLPAPQQHHSRRGGDSMPQPCAWCSLRGAGLVPVNPRRRWAFHRPRAIVRPVAIPADCNSRVVIIGAGIAGLATSIALTRVGVPNVVLERLPGPEAPGASIALQTNAWKALELLGVGVADSVRSGTLELERLELCTSEGVLNKAHSFANCTGGPHEFRGVKRQSLVAALHQACKNNVVYGVEVEEFECPLTGAPAITLPDGTRAECRALVGADGARSRVARELGVAPPNFAGMTAHRGVAVFPKGVPPSVVPLGTVRQIWGKGVRAGLYPINDREVYWFTVFNDSGEPIRLTQGEILQEALGLVRGWAGGIEVCIRATPAGEVVRNRIVDRWAAPGSFMGRGASTLVGDALHPMTPNLGQGGACALEGAVRLAGRLSRTVGCDRQSVAAAMREYEREQTARAFPLQAKSYAMGFALHITAPPVPAIRDLFVSQVMDLSHFLDHATFSHPPLEAAAGTVTPDRRKTTIRLK